MAYASFGVKVMKLSMRLGVVVALFALFVGHAHAQSLVSYTVGGTLSGLAAGKSLVLLKNGTTPLSLTANGSFVFSAAQASGNYVVTVGIQPSGQSCVVSNGSGNVTGANVSNVSVNCSNTYTVSGTVIGLTSSSLVLRMNASSLVVTGGAATFRFATGLSTGAAYAITVGIQPAGYSCSVTNGVGVINAVNIDNVKINCVATYTVSGVIKGLTASGLVLKLNNASSLITSGATSFKFSTALQTGTAYSVAVTSQPTAQVCLLVNASGVIGSANVTNVFVDCNAVTVPSSPTISNVVAGNGFTSVSFSAPASNGGAVITGYTLKCSSGSTALTATGVSSPLIVNGLTNLSTYTCYVTASNNVGTGSASASIVVTPYAGTTTTASILCPYSQSTPNITLTTGVTATSTSSWTCTGTVRSLTANGIPDHQIGTFPGPGNPNVPSAQSVNASAPLSPVAAPSNTAARLGYGYALNGVKFDPGTGGTCPNTATKSSDCSAIGSDPWKLEALGVAKSFFNFGTDSNNAHVQPTGAYHYHGMPEGILTKMGVTSANPSMALIGWAPDGYPIYARYGHTIPTDLTSPLKAIQSSWRIQLTPDTGRPSQTDIPMGVFLQDYEYVTGLGDLDDCNGRFDVTPEFPNGIYHYYATDDFPYFPRCWKGVVN